MSREQEWQEIMRKDVAKIIELEERLRDEHMLFVAEDQRNLLLGDRIAQLESEKRILHGNYDNRLVCITHLEKALREIANLGRMIPTLAVDAAIAIACAALAQAEPTLRPGYSGTTTHFEATGEPTTPAVCGECGGSGRLYGKSNPTVSKPCPSCTAQGGE